MAAEETASRPGSTPPAARRTTSISTSSSSEYRAAQSHNVVHCTPCKATQLHSHWPRGRATYAVTVLPSSLQSLCGPRQRLRSESRHRLGDCGHLQRHRRTGRLRDHGSCITIGRAGREGRTEPSRAEPSRAGPGRVVCCGWCAWHARHVTVRPAAAAAPPWPPRRPKVNGRRLFVRPNMGSISSHVAPRFYTDLPSTPIATRKRFQPSLITPKVSRSRFRDRRHC